MLTTDFRESNLDARVGTHQRGLTWPWRYPCDPLARCTAGTPEAGSWTQTNHILFLPSVFFTVKLFLFSFIHILQIDPAGYYWPGHYNEVHFYLVVHIITESAWETTMIICPGFLFTFYIFCSLAVYFILPLLLLELFVEIFLIF